MQRVLLVCALISLILLAGQEGPRNAGAQGQAGRGIVAMEYSNDEPHGLRSLLAHGRQLTYVQPRWLHLNRSAGGQLDSAIDTDMVAEARGLGVTIVPVLDNLDGAQARPAVVREVLADPTQRATVVRSVAATLAEHGFGGIDIYFQGLLENDRTALAVFLRELRAELQPSGRIVILTGYAHESDTAQTRALGQMAADVDYVRALITGEHHTQTGPGPAASAGFFSTTLAAVAAAVGPSKLIVGLTMVGGDWAEAGPARETSFPVALALATARQGAINWEPPTSSLMLSYTEGGQQRRAYFEDALTLSAKLSQIEARGLAGVSLERLGIEDPTLWLRLSAGGGAGELQRLTAVEPPPFQVIGDGEVWDAISSTSRAGRREFTVEPDGTVSEIRYVELPTLPILDRTGVPSDDKVIALTFDDGPSREWTPRVLDLLKERGVPATFFVVGRHALGNRDLIQRMFGEGHEVASHTFTHTALSQMSPVQLVFELNATRYVIAGLTGRTMHYIRSPFVANPNPLDEGPSPQPGDFLLPLLRAREFGYLTVGNQLDPRDWERPGVAQIVAAATNRSGDSPGHIILLHDSGGDRSQTLQALPIIIDFYQSEGYRFTTVSSLLGKDKDFGMPPVRAADTFAVGFVAGGLNVLQFLENVLLFLLYVSIGVGVLRTTGLVVLGLVQYWQRRPEPFRAREIQPFVSVLVPAYNEEKVIGNTIESLLRSNYRNYEIIVIDDGSRDGTLVAARRYEGHPRVRVIAKENGGKSSALNRGIQEAHGEVIIAMDADTVFDPNFIPYVLGHFRDPNVGAASGNAKVGNREDLIANWQSIEYITSFNLDRRAYTLLNCVTVVPGAAGAWRRRDLIAAGGFKHDTLAEDADLTVNVRRLGRRIVYEDRAIAWTEAPNKVRDFVKQRRRWSFGTLQMLTKHRDVLFRPRYGALGFVAFPFSILYLSLSLIAPAIDVAAIWSVVTQIAEDVHLNREAPMSADMMLRSLFWVEGAKPLLYYVVFILIEWIQSVIAFWMDRERPWPLLWVPVQRFVLRWLMYYVLAQTLLTALRGVRVGWGKLERKGTVLGSAGAPRT